MAGHLLPFAHGSFPLCVCILKLLYKTYWDPARSGDVIDNLMLIQFESPCLPSAATFSGGSLGMDRVHSLGDDCDILGCLFSWPVTLAMKTVCGEFRGPEVEDSIYWEV